MLLPALQAPLNARLARRQRELEEEETERKRKEAAAAKLRALDEAIAARDAERSVARSLPSLALAMLNTGVCGVSVQPCCCCDSGIILLVLVQACSGGIG